LVKEYSTLEIEADDKYSKNVAVYILFSLVENSFISIKSRKKIQISPIKLLKGRKDYNTEINKKEDELSNSINSLSTMGYSLLSYINWVICYSLLEYNLEGIDSAENILKRGIKFLQELNNQLPKKRDPLSTDIGYYEERLQESLISLIHFQCRKVLQTPPSFFRNRVEDSLSKFPCNHLLLSLYVENEARSGIAGRLREHFDKYCKQQDSTLLWLFAIKTETKQGSDYRKRNLFERSLSSSSSRKSIELWKEYIKFEVGNDNGKLVYSRAYRNIPWSKDIWISGPIYLNQSLEVDELEEIMQLMTEKEIRQRYPIL